MTLLEFRTEAGKNQSSRFNRESKALTYIGVDGGKLWDTAPGITSIMWLTLCSSMLEDLAHSSSGKK